MTSGKRPKSYIPDEPAPSPTPAAVEEMVMAGDVAKKKAQKKGRGSQIFAGRLNRQIFNFGKTRVGE